MLRFIGVRILQSIPLLLGVILISFVLLELTPGDPVSAMVGDYPVPPEYRAQLTEEFHLDDPLPVRLVSYVGNLAQGNLGHSFASNRPVSELLLSRLPNTLALTIPALTIAVVVGTTFGAWGAASRHKGLDSAVTLAALGGFSIPVFWLAQLLVIVFALQLTWLPVQGMRPIIAPQDMGLAAGLWSSAKYFVLPVLALAAREMGIMARMTRAGMLESMSQDYIMTARAKGLTRRQISLQHALRNSLLPLTSVIGYRFGHALGGTILIETVFAWPGLGRLLYESIGRRDNTVIVGIFVFAACSVLVVNLLTDLVYGVLDPRVRRG